MQPLETQCISSDSGLDKMKQTHGALAFAKLSDITSRHDKGEDEIDMFNSVRKSNSLPNGQSADCIGQASKAYKEMVNDRMKARKPRALPPPISVPQRSRSTLSAPSTFIPSPLSIGSLNSISTGASSLCESIDEIRSPRPVFNRGPATVQQRQTQTRTWPPFSDDPDSAAQSSTLVDADTDGEFRLRSVDGYQRKQFNSRPPYTREPEFKPKPFLVTAGPALRPLGCDQCGRWTYALALTLENIFQGMHSQFGIVRRLRSGQTKNVVIELDIPPGCRPGTQILCREVGNELPTGKLEDVILVIEKTPHRLFRRMGDDLFMDVRVPWSNDLKRQPKKIHITNIDNEVIDIFIDHTRDKSFSGSLSIRNAGMPIRERGKLVGRGKLIVRWEIAAPSRDSSIHSVLSRFFRHGSLKS